jgi:signal transduction histidine kinase
VSIIDVFDTTGFMRRWNCGSGWDDGQGWYLQGWFNIVSDLAVFGAYMAIPAVLTYFILRRRDVPFSKIFWLFAAFIFACGTTHLMEAILFWWPAYRLAGLIKFITGVVSWATVFALVPTVPRALALPGLKKVNSDLQDEIAKRAQAQEQLQALNETLEQRVIQRTTTLQDYQNQLSSMASEMNLTQSRERRRIAKELHDNLAQMLAVCQMKLSAVNSGNNNNSVRMLHEVSDTLARATEFTRTLMSELSPPMLYDIGLREAFEWLAKRLQKQHNFEVVIEGPHLNYPPDEYISSLLYESTRELLFNTIKYAGVNRATIDVSQSESSTKVIVSDEGVGFNPESLSYVPSETGGLGLFSLREKFRMAGGRFEIHSAPHQGTSVTLEIPNHHKTKA